MSADAKRLPMFSWRGPVPRPGVLDISVYVPGASVTQGPGSFKLSSNESPLGPSPKAVEADRWALDPELASGVLDTIRTLAERGMTLIVVSHEMNFARKLTRSVHFVADGVIMESGTPDTIFGKSESDRLTSFIRTAH